MRDAAAQYGRGGGSRVKFGTFIISPEETLLAEAKSVLAGSPHVSFVQEIPKYPESDELGRLLRIYQPEAVLISAAELDQVARIARALQVHAPGVELVAAHATREPAMLLRMMHLGIREFLDQPLQPETMKAFVDRILSRLNTQSGFGTGTNLVYSFLPAKQGSGTTTVALNVAAACARLQGGHTFLGDFDLSGGLIRFLLGLDAKHSVIDAAGRWECIDEGLWSQVATRWDMLDVGHAGRLRPDFRVAPDELRNLIGYLRKAYKAVFCDLSGNMEEYSLEIMRESKQIVVVITPEIPCLRLAHDKIRYLEELGFGDKIAVLLNRCDKRALIDAEDIKQLTGRVAEWVLPNDDQSVATAVLHARTIDQRTPLGTALQRVAESLVAVPQSERGSGSGRQSRTLLRLPLVGGLFGKSSNKLAAGK